MYRAMTGPVAMLKIRYDLVAPENACTTHDAESLFLKMHLDQYSITPDVHSPAAPLRDFLRLAVDISP